MKRILARTLLIFAVGLISSQILAANLMQVYQQALNNDPTFKIARSTWLSQKENIAISRAGLLPTFDVDAGYKHNFNHNSGAHHIRQRFHNNTGGLLLDLKQPIFNYEAWASLKQAKANEKDFAAQYSAAAQQLMFDTADAYFSVLKARDTLTFTTAEKRSLKSQLERTRERYKVGVATITDLQQARSQYDATVAQEIQDRNSLAIEKEKLREITNHYYDGFSQLATKLPLLYPNPADIDQWVHVAQRQNYSLQAARFAAEAAKENIAVQVSGHLPVLDAEGKYQYTHDSNSDGQGFSTNSNVATVGLDLALPVFEGGSVVAKTSQAQYEYQSASYTLERTDRTVVSDTRQGYLNVISGVNTIKADRQAVISARSSLASTRAGYEVGTQTMVDVLGQESALYRALKNYASAKYDYLISMVALKQAAGTLSVADLQDINSWLRGGPVAAPTIKPVMHKVRAVMHQALPKNYTIQLLATKSHRDALSFLKHYKFSAKTYVLRTCKAKQHWYVLTVGSYKTYAAAKAAVRRLPAHIRNMHPWVRSHASLHKIVC